jgi:hypothetical protein
MFNNGLNGTIPAELELLTGLQTMSFKGGKVSATLHPEL